jgi:hypothetical protein
MYEDAKSDEIWKPLIHQNQQVEGYFVSNYGTILGKKGNPLKWNMNNTGNYPRVGLTLPKEQFSHYTNNSGTNNVKTNAKVHVLVADAHLPFEDNLPAVWDEFVELDGRQLKLWDLMTHYQKEILRSAYYIDHIDSDKMNAHTSNLRYVSPRENSHAHHYGI